MIIHPSFTLHPIPHNMGVPCLPPCLPHACLPYLPPMLATRLPTHHKMGVPNCPGNGCPMLHAIDSEMGVPPIRPTDSAMGIPLIPYGCPINWPAEMGVPCFILSMGVPCLSTDSFYGCPIPLPCLSDDSPPVSMGVPCLYALHSGLTRGEKSTQCGSLRAIGRDNDKTFSDSATSSGR